MPWYCDSSALLKLVAQEPETSVFEVAVQNRKLVASELAITEVGRAIERKLGSAFDAIDEVSARVGLMPITSALLRQAIDIRPASLRTLDAIHIASAMQLGSDLEGVLTYDIRMQQAARELNLRVEAPGQAADGS
ncbi:MAG: type II toxin-antitoxin system VapC family toxin [Dehalococcoidia bacterium]